MSIDFWAGVSTIISALIAAMTLYFTIKPYWTRSTDKAKHQGNQGLIVPEHVRKQKAQKSKRKIVLVLAIISIAVFLISSGVLFILQMKGIGINSSPVQATMNTTEITKTAIAVAKTATSITGENETATAPAQPIAVYDLYPPYTGKLVMDDPLVNNIQGNGWQTFSGLGVTESNACQFSKAEGGYDVQTASSNDCYATKAFPTSLGLQVDMQFLSGTCGGIFIHRFIQGKVSKHFAFYICKDKSYQIFISSNLGDNKLASTGISQAIVETNNVLAIIAKDNNVDFYINFQHVYHYLNSDVHISFQEALVGMSAIARDGKRDDILFSNAKVWVL